MPPGRIPRAAATAALTLLATLAACQKSTPEEPAMNTEAPQQDQAPHLSAEEVGKRFLKMIGKLNSPEELGLEFVQKEMGVPYMKPTPESRGFHYFSEPLEKGWQYTVEYYEGDPALKRSTTLWFGHDEGISDEMPESVCKLDFEDYDKALKAMGFFGEAEYGEFGELRRFVYLNRKGVQVQIIPQNIVPGFSGRLCVSSIKAR